MKVSAVDVGGTGVKILPAGQQNERRFLPDRSSLNNRWSPAC
jgi:hypothetical protein